MIEIDGRHGEGGGQILRTAIALGALCGKEVRVRNIRANRPKPGLAPQHLAAVCSVAGTCQGRLEGDALGSTELHFVPGHMTGGDREIDVGTAGSVTLVLQSCLLALSRTDFTLKVRGGTDVRHAPPIDHYSLVLLPLLRRMGYDLHLEVVHRGFYPEGGGEVWVKGIGTSTLRSLDLKERGDLIGIEGSSFSQNLPEHVTSRMAMECKRLLVRHGTVKMGTDARQGISTGAGVELAAVYQNTILGASKLGERGLRSEAVAKMACDDLEREMTCATLDRYSADQIVPYLALADGPSEIAVCEMTEHLRTQMWLLPQFLPVHFDVRGTAPVRITVSPNRT
ncbi:MAG: RNA 3'-terminal-phosphate cyclase [Methanomassiliicoccales archaeon PtaU1.Bin124]|nr:MAG: RNA 3'-terminal-phosphate cyclase [Methanomassiliicoccales archaeon PtaU1.Bin124]